MGWDWLVLDGLGGSWQLDGHLVHPAVGQVPVLSEVVAVEDLALTTVDGDRATTLDVLRQVVLFLTEGHAWAVSEDRGLGELLALQQLGEGSSARVLSVDLLHLHGVVAQEVVQSVELVTAIVRVVFPEDLEAERLRKFRERIKQYR